MALVHYPVLNKQGDLVTSSVTTLDVHDFARVCRTFGVAELYIVTPLATQRRLVERMTKHWMEGFGASYNPHRKEALTHVKVVDSVEHMLDNFQLPPGEAKIITTGAKTAPDTVSCEVAKKRIETFERAALLFGTGHGLAKSVMDMADMRLAPIEGADEYNHLPVRCAAAIILDRLLGRGSCGEQ